jgi:curli biogenesis system outer membrane secretion channel CsgG
MKNWKWIATLSMSALVGCSLASQTPGLHPGGGPRIDQTQMDECVRKHAVMAFFRDDKGTLSPVRDTMNTDHDSDWISLRFSEYDGPRIRLGVIKVINKAPQAEVRQGDDQIAAPVAGIQEMLTAALYETKRFDVVEEKRIKEVEGEQMRKDVQEPSPNSIMNVGKVLGAQYLVYGTVNEWDPNRASQGMGSGRLIGIGSQFLGKTIGSLGAGTTLGSSKKEAEVAVTYALTDVANGQILFTTSERARLGEWHLHVGVTGGAGAGSAANTPVNYVVRACANKAAYKIATFLRTRKWKGSVVQMKGADIFINAGSQQGMSPDTKLAVQAVRGIVRDPENHTILGEDLHGIGTLKVIAVQPGFSIARVFEGCNGLKPGDRVELATDPVPPQRIPGCDALDPSQTI